MRTAIPFLLALAFFASPVQASDLTLRAGRLIYCTLEEPNFSSASAQAGEPTVCYLGQLREFGHTAFPRGSYLTGRLADYREPGRITGKGRQTPEAASKVTDTLRAMPPFGLFPFFGRLICCACPRADRTLCYGARCRLPCACLMT